MEVERGSITIPLGEYERLKKRINYLERERDRKDEIINRYYEKYMMLVRTFLGPVIETYKFGRDSDEVIEFMLSKVHFDTSVRLSESSILLFWSSRIPYSSLTEVKEEDYYA